MSYSLVLVVVVVMVVGGGGILEKRFIYGGCMQLFIAMASDAELYLMSGGWGFGLISVKLKVWLFAASVGRVMEAGFLLKDFYLLG